jgi:uncharacterized membrane protein YdjX (TVP38/TMEM64 family)
MKAALKIISRVLLLLLIPVLVSYFLGHFIHVPAFSFDSQAIATYVKSFGVLAPIVYIFFEAITIPLVLVPDVIVATAGGILFDFRLAVIYTTTAWIIGTTFNFYLSKTLGRPFLEKLLSNGEIKQLDTFTENIGWKMIFLSWFIPGGTADIAGFAAGLTEMSYSKYITAAAPAAFLLAVFTSAAGATISISPILVSFFTVAAVLGLILGFKSVLIYQGVKYLLTKIKAVKIKL